MLRFLRSILHPRPRLTVPEYPLRCQNCPRLIRFSGHPAGGFVDAAGGLHCPDSSIRHQPMPSVLG